MSGTVRTTTPPCSAEKEAFDADHLLLMACREGNAQALKMLRQRPTFRHALRTAQKMLADRHERRGIEDWLLDRRNPLGARNAAELRIINADRRYLRNITRAELAKVYVIELLIDDWTDRRVRFFMEPQVRQRRNAINARHDKSGGSRHKRRRIQEEWKSGRYPSREACAAALHQEFGMSFETARKALYNTPTPTR